MSSRRESSPRCSSPSIAAIQMVPPTKSRSAAGVGEMNLSARHTGDHDGRAGHVDLLNIHAKLGEEAFFLRDPKRANPSADIGVTDDDFRRRDEKPRCED